MLSAHSGHVCKGSPKTDRTFQHCCGGSKSIHAEAHAYDVDDYWREIDLRSRRRCYPARRPSHCQSRRRDHGLENATGEWPGIRIVRSPGVFPKHDLPIILLTGGADRLRVIEGIQPSVHEFLCKLTSPGALRDRLVSILVRPRPMVQTGKHYVPKLRRAAIQHGLNARPVE